MPSREILLDHFLNLSILPPMNCLCGSNLSFNTCCEPFLSGKASPETAEQLMRSRYTAYTRSNIDYLKNTLSTKSQSDFDPKSTREWAEGVEWKSLKIISTDKGGPSDKKGTVEFTAIYKHKDETIEHHEVATFQKNDHGQWRFVDGDAHTHKEGESHDHGATTKPKTVVRETPKIGRNDPCHCGSTKKFKKCCGS